MPTMRQRITALIASAVIVTGGAWIASQIPAVEAEEVKTKKAAGLEVTVDGVRNGKGQVIVLVVDSREAFKSHDYEKAAGYQEIPAATCSIQAFFPNLNTGPYAVIAFHDENENRDLDMAGQIPTEGYTVSGARDAYDEPPFRRAASEEPAQTVRLFYLN